MEHKEVYNAGKWVEEAKHEISKKQMTIALLGSPQLLWIIWEIRNIRNTMLNMEERIKDSPDTQVDEDDVCMVVRGSTQHTLRDSMENLLASILETIEMEVDYDEYNETLDYHSLLEGLDIELIKEGKGEKIWVIDGIGFRNVSSRKVGKGRKVCND